MFQDHNALDSLNTYNVFSQPDPFRQNFLTSGDNVLVHGIKAVKSCGHIHGFLFPDQTVECQVTVIHHPRSRPCLQPGFLAHLYPHYALIGLLIIDAV